LRGGEGVAMNVGDGGRETFFFSVVGSVVNVLRVEEPEEWGPAFDGEGGDFGISFEDEEIDGEGGKMTTDAGEVSEMFAFEGTVGEGESRWDEERGDSIF